MENPKEVVAYKMTLEEAKAQLSKAVYQATVLFETLEARGYIAGNGHHARQKIARLAVDDLENRWKQYRSNSSGSLAGLSRVHAGSSSTPRESSGSFAHEPPINGAEPLILSRTFSLRRRHRLRMQRAQGARSHLQGADRPARCLAKLVRHHDEALVGLFLQRNLPLNRERRVRGSAMMFAKAKVDALESFNVAATELHALVKSESVE